MGVFGRPGLDRKAPVKAFLIALQKAIGFRDGGYACQTKFFDQAILERLKAAFDASLGLRGVSADQLDIDGFQDPANLGQSQSQFDFFPVDPEHGVLVGVEAYRPAILGEVMAHAVHVRLAGLSGIEAHKQNPAAGIVDKHDQCAYAASLFEPPMMGAVDLDQFSEAGPSFTQLMDGCPTLPANRMQPFLDHPFAQRGNGNANAVPLKGLLLGECRLEVMVELPDIGHHFLTKPFRQTTVTGPASLPGNQPCGPLLSIPADYAPDLSNTQVQTLGCPLLT